MKSRFFKILIVLSIFFCIVVVKYKVDRSKNNQDPSLPDSEEGRRELETQYLKAALSFDLIPYANIEVSAIKNILIGKEQEAEYLALSLFPNQAKKNSGIRSEISIDYPFQEGDVVEYSWQFRIPENFPSDAPKNRWWVFAQCHDQPDKNKGETWDSYTPHSPPIIFGYGNLNGKDKISFTSGLDGSEKGIEPRGTITLTKNIWHSIRFVVKWSQKESGEVNVYYDNSTTPTFFSKGPNMLNAFQHYFKLGQYRNAEINTENTVHIKNVSIKKIR